MGGGGSHTKIIQTIVQVRADPRLLESLTNFQNKTVGLQKTIQNLDVDLKRMQAQARRLSDPTLYKRYREQAFDKFVDSLQNYDFKKPIQKQSSSERHHIIIGNISSGKSSLLNTFFNLNQPIAIGECTQKPKKVTKVGNVHIWDSPGMNQQFKIYDPEVLAFFHCADKIFIFFPDSLKSCQEIVKVLGKIKPNETFIVRTQTDNWNPNMKKTIKQQIETDIALLKKWKLNLPVYATSAKKNLDYQDNLTIKNLIQNP